MNHDLVHCRPYMKDSCNLSAGAFSVFISFAVILRNVTSRFRAEKAT